MKQFLVSSLLLLWAMVPLAVQAEVYRWVDEDGVTHFGDKAPQGQKAKKLNVQTTSPSQGTTVGSGRHAYDPQKLKENEQRFLESVAAERRAKERHKAEQARQQAEREKRCTALHNRLLNYREGFAMVRRNQEGEIEYLSDAEIKARHAQLEAEWQKQCEGGTSS